MRKVLSGTGTTAGVSQYSKPRIQALMPKICTVAVTTKTGVENINLKNINKLKLRKDDIPLLLDTNCLRNQRKLVLKTF